MDKPTVAVYDAGAGRYAASRRAYEAEAAERFAAGIEGWRADLGCGPGLYVPHLGAPLVAIDASLAMLRESGAAHALQSDVAALPFRRGALAGAWASKCHQHLLPEELPAALADLH